MSIQTTYKRLTGASSAALLLVATSLTAVSGIVNAAVVNPTPAAKVTFTFDDGMASSYTQAAPTLKKYGLSGTNYVTTGCVGMTTAPNTCRADNDVPYMTWTQIKDLQNTYGWEIGSHTATHPYLASSDAGDGQPNVLTRAQVVDELTKSKNAFTAQGINTTAFASPYGDYNNMTTAEIAKLYATHRGFAENRNIDWPNNEYLLSNMPVQSGVTVAAVKTRIDQAIANKQWLILTFHDIRVNASTNPDDYQYKTADLDAIAAYVKLKQDAGQIKSINVSQGPTHGAAGDNLLPNSSFDNGLAEGWTTDNSSAVTKNTSNNGSYPSPTNSIKFTPSAAPARLYSPKVSVNPGSTYLLKNFLNVTSVNVGQVEFYIDEYDINGNWISGQYKKAEASAYVENLNFTYKPTSLAVSKAGLQITSTANSGITAYLDNVQWLALDTSNTNPEPPTTITKTVIADADTTIKKATPATNFGATTSMLVDNSPVSHSLIKFDVRDTAGSTVQSAKIRLYTLNSSASGGTFYRTTSTGWIESSVNWNNAPVANTTPFAAPGAVTAGQWIEIDVSSFIKGDGLYSIRITSSSPNGASYSTRESATNKPQLIVVTTHNTTNPEPTNLVAGGNFDTGISNGWTTDTSTNITHDSTSQGSPSNPVHSVKLVAAPDHSSHLFSPKVAVDSTKTYNLAAYVRLNALTSGELGFYIDEYDDAGNWISGQYKYGVGAIAAGNVSFTYVPSSALVTSATLQVIVPADSGIIGYFDDVQWYVAT